MKQICRILLLVSTTFLLLFAQESKRALTFDDMMTCKQIGSPTISISGKTIAFTIKTVNEKDNSSHKEIYTIKFDGSDLKQITSNESSSGSPKWSPTSNNLAYINESQIWMLSTNLDNPVQLTSHYTGVNSFIWSPDGKKIAFTSSVYPECKSQEEIEQKDIAIENNKVKARVYENLMYRHWNEWWDYKRSHIFILSLDTKEIKDVTPGDFDAPPIALGSGYCFSPDSKTLYFSSNHNDVIATSTDNDIWAVSINGGEQKLVSTGWDKRDFGGNDQKPQFSPKGKYLSFLSMKESGFEADKQDLILKNMKTGKFTNITKNLIYSISSYEWLPNEKELLCRIDHEGRYKICKLSVKTGKLKFLFEEGYNNDVQLTPKGNSFVFLNQTFLRPYELFTGSVKTGKVKQITDFNKDVFANIDMNPGEDFWFEGAGGTKVHGFLIKPPHFDPNKKYPMVYMVHGGPQGAWHDGWHFRWNAEMRADQGYVMVLVNPRGSTGYGQEFTNGISQDWAGKVFTDLINGQKYVIDTYKFIDSEKIAAAGASYGGYMMNWIEGHMDAFKYPFKTLVNHDGSFNLYSMLLTTEELWFPEKEFGGVFWENENNYKKFSPHNYINNFKTPMLLIHGENDFRLAYTESLMPFTALRKKGIDAKLVIFPDEDHFVQKPQNSRFWHKTIFDWLNTYIK